MYEVSEYTSIYVSIRKFTLIDIQFPIRKLL